MGVAYKNPEKQELQKSKLGLSSTSQAQEVRYGTAMGKRLIKLT